MDPRIDLAYLSQPEAILLTDPLKNSTRLIRRNLLLISVIGIIAAVYGGDKITPPFVTLPREVLLGLIGIVVIYKLINFILNYVTDVQGWWLTQRVSFGEQNLEGIKALSEQIGTVESEIRQAASNVSADLRIMYEQIKMSHEQLVDFLDKSTYSEKKNIELSGLIKNIQVFETNIKPSSKGYRMLNRLSKGDYDFEFSRLGKVVEHLKEHSTYYMNQVAAVKKETIQLRIWLYTRVLLWEGLFPVMLGFLALWMSYSSISVFLEKVINVTLH